MDEKKRNDDALFEALNKAKKKKRRKRWLTALIIIGIIVIALMITVTVLRRKVDARVATDEDKVLSKEAAYGSISTRVSGSGNIEDVDTEIVTVPEGVEIDEVVVTANTKLREGDAIATLDLTSVLSTMAAVQDEIGAQQLRRMIALSYDIQVSDSEIDLTYRQKAMRLRLSGENVILTPGTQYCFTDVEDCSFHLDGRVIRMVLERENESVEKVLGVLP
jgi:multidrug efflux pump subunit AcrA (membrane-fusion protein)